MSRRHGLAASRIAAIEIVTADGQSLRVDGESEDDLFWASRGGGGSFGADDRRPHPPPRDADEVLAPLRALGPVDDTLASISMPAQGRACSRLEPARLLSACGRAHPGTPAPG